MGFLAKILGSALIKVAETCSAACILVLLDEEEVPQSLIK